MTSATHTVYSGRTTNWPMVALTIGLLVPLVLTARGSGDSWTTPAVFVPLVLLVVVTVLETLLTATSLRTTAGPNGITVHLGALGWPHVHYPLDRVERVEAVTVGSWWSGWGLFWLPRRGLMLTLRPGPALRLVLTNGRKVTISTPAPADAVRAIDEARRARS
jgi:hypothetical protein